MGNKAREPLPVRELDGCTCNAPAAHLHRLLAIRTATRPRDTLADMLGLLGHAGPSGPRSRLHSGPRTPRQALLLAGITLAVLAACTRVSDDQPFPPVQDRLAIARTIPEQGDTIPVGAQIDFCFDGHVDPRALDDFAATVSSGCVYLRLRARPPAVRLAPARRRLRHLQHRLVPRQRAVHPPRVELRPGALYHVRLQPEAVGWAGEKLDVTTPGWIRRRRRLQPQRSRRVPARVHRRAQRRGHRHRHGHDTDEHPGDALPAPTLTDLFAPGPGVQPDNPACSCHREGDDLARARLDLSSPSAAFADLVLPAH
jgi:hypothetical protein